MGFIEYILWRLQQFVRGKRDCKTCRGSDGNCDKCNGWRNLYKKDWQKSYWEKWWRRHV